MMNTSGHTTFSANFFDKTSKHAAPLLLGALLSASLAAPAVSQDAAAQDVSAAEAASTSELFKRKTLGRGELFTNDTIGDGEDRWRSGSVAVSLLRGHEWTGSAPAQWGQLLEYRFRGEVISPENLANPAAGDRPYVGALSFGLHSYAQRGNVEMRGGLDAVIVGPQSGVADFQDLLHDVFGTDEADLTTQLGDAIYPTASGEVARTFEVKGAELRPFAEVQLGVESFARVGVDLNLGTPLISGLQTRDVTTGHRYQTISQGIEPGAHFVLGADVAHVFSSEYLPEEDGFVLEDMRARVRAGVTLSAPKASAFYGLTWLSPEFEAQTESQIVGSMNLKFDF